MINPSELHKEEPRAFVLRIAPSGIDSVHEALECKEVIIGWSGAKGLLNEELDWEKFREILHNSDYSDEKDYRKSGSAAGNMWRFIREMKLNDLVVVPHGDSFYVAEVTGKARYDETKIEEDTAYRRPVKWLNDQKKILRRYARSALQSRLKSQQVCTPAEDLVGDIEEVLTTVQAGKTPKFETDLRSKLVKATIEEIQRGRIDPYGMESLVKTVLESIGATNVRIVPRSKDKGADLLADFSLANTFVLKFAVQVKHWETKPPHWSPVGKDEIEQLENGMDAEGTQLGLFITSGTFSESAEKKAQELLLEKGYRIELVDGTQFATLIVEGGLAKIVSHQ